MGHPRPSCCHADDGGSALSNGRPIAARRIGEECQEEKFIAVALIDQIISGEDE
jgi:hypothetical protein